MGFASGETQRATPRGVGNNCNRSATARTARSYLPLRTQHARRGPPAANALALKVESRVVSRQTTAPSTHRKGRKYLPPSAVEGGATQHSYKRHGGIPTKKGRTLAQLRWDKPASLARPDKRKAQRNRHDEAPDMITWLHVSYLDSRWPSSTHAAAYRSVLKASKQRANAQPLRKLCKLHRSGTESTRPYNIPDSVHWLPPWATPIPAQTGAPPC